MSHDPDPRIRQAWERIDRDRLLDTAQRLIAVPSWTGEAGACADALAELLRADGFEVERPEVNHPPSPAVVARLDADRPGRTLQFNGHLDVVHLPFVPPRVEGDLLRGSGSSDMKGGTAAAIEAFRALRDSGVLPAGSVLLTAHDMHEAPWGFGEQFDRMVADGIVGDAVLIPEPLSDRLAVVGRGAATWAVTLRREGAPVHEVMRPAGLPDVIGAGARLATRIGELAERLSALRDDLAGAESAFIGQVHAGEIYNQAPTAFFLEGTRRWLPGGTPPAQVREEFEAIVHGVARASGLTAEVAFRQIRDAFKLDVEHPAVAAFRSAYRLASGSDLPIGPKPFVDDGNSVCALAGVPAITHGPRAGGQHTVEEWASIDDLVRVARVYAATAIGFCAGG